MSENQTTKRRVRHQYDEEDCPLCLGTGIRETVGDLHRSAGIIPCDHYVWKEISNGQ